MGVSDDGDDVAQWLANEGAMVFVVHYRVGTMQTPAYPKPLMDGTRALTIVRGRSKAWGLDPTRVAVFGSSAGGHLAAFVATHGMWSQSGSDFEPPDYVALVAPVALMTLSRLAGDRGTRIALLGPVPDPTELRVSSNALWVTKQAHVPPTYVFHCVDDPIVSSQNSDGFANALAAASVPFTYVRGDCALHGMRARDFWRDSFAAWMASRRLTRSPPNFRAFPSSVAVTDAPTPSPVSVGQPGPGKRPTTRRRRWRRWRHMGHDARP